MYRGLADALREAIQRGELASGARLPAERQLAERLLVSRTTVVAAYELLRQEGLVQRRQGSGTHVRSSATVAEPRVQRAVGASDRLNRNTLFRGLTELRSDTVDLVGAYLLSPHGLPTAVLGGLELELARISQSSGYAPLGYPPLRQAIAAHFTRGGLPTVADQVLVTTGAQQAIHLAAQLTLQPGDTVVVENPTYPGALDVFASAGARLAWVSTSQAGADVEALTGLLARLEPRLLYVIPTHHNPVGGVMPPQQRQRLAQLIAARSLVAIDDQSLAALSLESDQVPPPIASYASDAGILTVGSISKLGWGGLRVGWIRAPADTVARLGRLKAVTDLGTSLPGQVIATRLLEAFDALQGERRALLAERFELVSALLGKLLPTWSWQRPRGGLCLWVRLPHGTAADFAQVALRHGVSVVPGPIASADGSFGQYLRLPFGHEPATLEEGIRRLAHAWSTYQPGVDGIREKLEVIV